jgi:hypothetical protein
MGLGLIPLFIMFGVANVLSWFGMKRAKGEHTEPSAPWVPAHADEPTQPTHPTQPTQPSKPAVKPSTPARPALPSPRQQAQAAKVIPVAWPQVVPKELPKFPTGWEPFVPPPKAVSARAWQLLNELWKKGIGTTKVEQTAGQWVTYKAFSPSKGKKGVAAYKLKPGALPASQAVQI